MDTGFGVDTQEWDPRTVTGPWTARRDENRGAPQSLQSPEEAGGRGVDPPRPTGRGARRALQLRGASAGGRAFDPSVTPAPPSMCLP